MYRFGFFERLYGHHIGLMYFGLLVSRLQVQVCQGVIVLSCIVIRPTLPSELAIILDGTSSNPLEPHPDGRSSNLRLKDLPRARLEPATQWVTSGLPTTVLSPPNKLRRVDRRTNALPTNRPTDRPTDTGRYRGALAHLKTGGQTF